MNHMSTEAGVYVTLGMKHMSTEVRGNTWHEVYEY